MDEGVKNFDRHTAIGIAVAGGDEGDPERLALGIVIDIGTAVDGMKGLLAGRIIYVTKHNSPGYDSSRQADALPTEIEITPDMIAAGVRELSCYDMSEDGFDSAAIVRAVFAEMSAASETHHSS